MKRLLDKRLSLPSLVDRLVERLELAIMTGELPAGSPVREQALAERLGVSRGPLREAIRRLEGRKLVSRIPNLGARVASLSLKDLDEIWVVREALEGMAARLATMAMSEREIAGVQEALEHHRDTLAGGRWGTVYQEAPQLDFHYRIVRGSGNDRLIALLCDDLYYLLKVHRYRWSTTTPGRPEQALEEHKAILRALAARDADLAERLMRDHVHRSRENMLSQGLAAGADVRVAPGGEKRPAEADARWPVARRRRVPRAPAPERG